MTANDMKYNLLVKYDKIASILSPGYDDREITYLLNVAQQRVFFHLYNPLANKYQQGFEMSEKRRAELKELIRMVVISGITNTNETLYLIEATANNRIYKLSNGVSTEGLCENINIYNPNTYDNNLYSTNTPSAKIVTVLDNAYIRLDRQISHTVEVPGGTSLAFKSGLGLSKSQVESHTIAYPLIKGYLFDLPPSFLYDIEEGVITSESPTNYVSIKAVTHDYIRGNNRNPYKTPYKNLVWRLEFSRALHGVGLEDGTIINNIDQYQSTNKRVELITNGSTVTKYWLRYLKIPRLINCDEVNPENQIHCELDESIHDMIIDEAASFASSITNPEVYQIKTAEKAVSE